jgi:hypothetical protein
MTISEHGDLAVARMSFAEWFKHCYGGLEIPEHKRQCLYGGPFPCNGHCAMQQPRQCLQAQRLREEP